MWAQANPAANQIDIVNEGRRDMHADGMLVKRTKNSEPQTPDILVACSAFPISLSMLCTRWHRRRLQSPC